MQSRDGRFTASGHENGGVYLFSNETGRLLHSLPGKADPVFEGGVRASAA